MNDCVFCKIANKAINPVIIWEDESVIAFLDIAPIRRGHCQIIPTHHYETFEQVPSDIASKIVILGQKLAQKMKMVYKVDRVAFLFTGGDVPHAHSHVVPMHKKTDITSAQYIINQENIEFSSSHLLVDQDFLQKVKIELSFVETFHDEIGAIL